MKRKINTFETAMGFLIFLLVLSLVSVYPIQIVGMLLLAALVVTLLACGWLLMQLLRFIGSRIYRKIFDLLGLD